MNINLINELETILNAYADDSNYSTTTRQCEWVSNGVTEERFYEFDGDSSLAKRGLEIIAQLKANQPLDEEYTSDNDWILLSKACRYIDYLESKINKMKGENIND